MPDDRQNLSTMEQLASLRNFMDERRGRILPHPVGAAITTIKHLDDELAALRRAMTKISEGEGEFSRDPLAHASNCVENMKSIALTALCLTGDSDG